MYYIDIIADGERASKLVRVDFEDDAWEEFFAMEPEAVDLSSEYHTDFTLRMYDDNDNIIASTAYVAGKRIA